MREIGNYYVISASDISMLVALSSNKSCLKGAESC